MFPCFSHEISWLLCVFLKIKIMENIDYELIDNIEIEGIDTEDYPDFCDAFISSADYKDVPMTDKELEQLDNHKCFVHKCVMDYLF